MLQKISHLSESLCGMLGLSSCHQPLDQVGLCSWFFQQGDDDENVVFLVLQPQLCKGGVFLVTHFRNFNHDIIDFISSYISTCQPFLYLFCVLGLLGVI
jgi:hypothetical protein